MSLEDIRSECSETAGLLQPYVDGELASAEQERVGSHLEHCRGCRSAVSEQQWVRATLRAVERDRAPASLRARIGAALDEVDREDAVSSSGAAEASAAGLPARRPRTITVRTAAVPMRPSLWSRTWSMFGDMLRGGLVLAPAGAMAVGLFFVAREGLISSQPLGSHRLGTALVSSPIAHGGASDHTHEGDRPRPGDSLPPIGAGPRGELQLVRAELGRTPADDGASLRFAVVRGGQPTGEHLVDHQAPDHAFALSGTLVHFRGAQFHLARTAAGDPMLLFQRGGTVHRVILEGGHRAMPGPGDVEASTPDYAFLLDYATSGLDPQTDRQRAADHRHDPAPDHVPLHVSAP